MNNYDFRIYGYMMILINFLKFTNYNTSKSLLAFSGQIYYKQNNIHNSYNKRKNNKRNSVN